MHTTNWKSTIWQKLFSVYPKDEQHHHEKSRIGDEEEAHELLLSSSLNAKDVDDNADLVPPYMDDEGCDEDNDAKEGQDIESSQPDSKPEKTALEARRSTHEQGCAGRRASLGAAIILTVLLLFGLLILSRAGLTRDASVSKTTTPSHPYPNSPSDVTAPEEGNTPVTLTTPTTTTPIPSLSATTTTTPTPSSASIFTSTSTTSAIPSFNSPPPASHHPILRHSWTSLTPLQQQSYITALQCLRSLPPILPHMPTNASAYSDFPYVHAHIGYRTHNSASFLPWHRYFLSLYEQRLRQSCGYEAGIPYWDWSADADAHPNADLSASAVFDAVSGFGGNGDGDGDGDGNGNGNDASVAATHGGQAPSRGRCVTTGPFAGLLVLWYDVAWRPHCLSRGFRTDEPEEEEGGGGGGGGGGGRVRVMIDGSALRTVEIDRILELETYEEFVAALEKRVHDVVPFGVGGDFETFSAPFEPLFWLHHAQLDRLWNLWQRRRRLRLTGGRDDGGGSGVDGELEDNGQGKGRVFEYTGHKFRHSIEKATLGDVLEMGGVLGTDIRVREVMDVEGGCEGVVNEDDGHGDGEGRSGILCVAYV